MIANNYRLSLICVVLGILFVVVVLWSYIEAEFLNKITSIVTILSLVIAIWAYFGRQREKETEEKIRASKNLYGELRDTLEAIRGEKYPQDLLDFKLGDKKATYTNRFLNHGIYDGLVYSGQIAFLDYEIQHSIQEIFDMIKYHNYYLKLVAEERSEDGAISSTAWEL